VHKSCREKEVVTASIDVPLAITCAFRRTIRHEAYHQEKSQLKFFIMPGTF